jgi:antirestriction protein ArdC
MRENKMLKNEIHKKVADKVIEQMKTHGTGWAKPWTTKGLSDEHIATSMSTKNAYQGINTLILGIEKAVCGYSTGQWATFKQWKTRGANVIKGQKSTMVVFFKKINVKDEASDNENDTITIPLMRTFNVFNADQVDGYEPPVYEKIERREPQTVANQLALDVGAEVKNNAGDRAFYSPNKDFINMPLIEQFKNDNLYASTLLHELGHWTGHDTRLKRNLKNSFGTQDYAYEELVAELTNAMLCGSLNVDIEPRPDHAKYLNGWIEKLKNKPETIFRACAMAQTASNYLIQLQEDKKTIKKAA